MSISPYHNSKKEQAWGEFYFKNHVMPPDFNYKARKKELSPYWQQRGWYTPMMYADYYSRMSGVESDRYIPMDIYYFYILPALNRFDLRVAYTDKNLYTTIFDKDIQPRTVVKNINGIFLDADDKQIGRQAAIDIIAHQQGDCVIKPTIDSCNGNGIELINGASSPADISRLVDSYGRDFIVQEKLGQHPVMALLNPSSLNTMRMFTYRTLDKDIHFLDAYTFVRFGGVGAFKDNVSAGGGMSRVDSHGIVGEDIMGFRTFDIGSMTQRLGKAPDEQIRIPGFDAAVARIKMLHDRLPYFDLIGWDIAIDVDGNPRFIEFNIEPSIEAQQMVAGPAFGTFFDDMMQRIANPRVVTGSCRKNVFANGNEYTLIATK